MKGWQDTEPIMLMDLHPALLQRMRDYPPKYKGSARISYEALAGNVDAPTSSYAILMSNDDEL